MWFVSWTIIRRTEFGVSDLLKSKISQIKYKIFDFSAHIFPMAR